MKWHDHISAALRHTARHLAGYAAAGYTVGAVQWPVWIALYSVFARSGRRQREVAALIGPAAVVGYFAADRGPVDVVVNGRVVARGELVVMDDDNTRFGVSLTEIVGSRPTGKVGQ